MPFKYRLWEGTCDFKHHYWVMWRGKTKRFKDHMPLSPTASLWWLQIKVISLKVVTSLPPSLFVFGSEKGTIKKPKVMQWYVINKLWETNERRRERIVSIYVLKWVVLWLISLQCNWILSRKSCFSKLHSQWEVKWTCQCPQKYGFTLHNLCSFCLFNVPLINST